MVSFPSITIPKIDAPTLKAALTVSMGFTWGYLKGHTYAYFADLPLGRVARAYAVSQAVIFLIENFLYIFLGNNADVKNGKYICAGANIVVNAAMLHGLYNKGMMGNKMLIAQITVTALYIFNRYKNDHLSPLQTYGISDAVVDKWVNNINQYL